MSSGGGSDKSGSGGGGAVKTPSDFLKSIRGRPVVVKLNSGVDYRGSRRRSANSVPSTAVRATEAAASRGRRDQPRAAAPPPRQLHGRGHRVAASMAEGALGMQACDELPSV